MRSNGDVDCTVRAWGLRKSYGTPTQRTQVLCGVDLEARPGECVFLVGPSGSGKSTLLSILGCILTPDEGGVSILGQEVTGLKDQQRCLLRRQHIGFVFQRFHLFRGLTAHENVQMALRLQDVPGRQAADRARQLLEAVGLGDHVSKRVTRLSTGQQQRVAIARALVTEPALILADEPTAALDGQTGLGVMQLLRELAQRNHATVLVVTHDPRIMGREDRVLYLEDGRLKAMEDSLRAQSRAEVSSGRLRPRRSSDPGLQEVAFS